jgi:uncharacterized protein
MTAVLTISPQTQRRFVLGKQGLYPGRRWQGKAGVMAALRAGADVQVDPLHVVARSHDIALHGRVLNYQPSQLTEVLYEDRTGFETGGSVNVYPIEELPYFRVVMARKQHEARQVQFAEEHAETLEMVRQAMVSQGPQSAANFAESPTRKSTNTFRSGKVANQALYYLWLTGETLTSHRQGLERVFDLRERLVPAQFNVAATADEAAAFFALKVLQRGGLLSAQQWRTWFAGTIGLSVRSAEVAARLEALLSEEKIVRVFVEDEPKIPYLLLAEDLPLLEQLHAGRLPHDWEPLETTTEEEMTFLAPLDIVSARGRALPLFDFEYLWEVYKPPEQRRWGYYTLPVLYQERLVARTDLKLERTTNTLVVKGFWLEHHATTTEAFMAALARAFQRFMHFIAADTLDATLLTPTTVRERIESVLASLE